MHILTKLTCAKDIELNNGYSQYYPAMISTMRENFATDPTNTYYISGAPQCPIPEPNSMLFLPDLDVRTNMQSTSPELG